MSMHVFTRSVSSFGWQALQAQPSLAEALLAEPLVFVDELQAVLQELAGQPTARSTDSERLGDAGLGPDDVGQRQSLGDVTAASAVWDFVEAHAAELDADTGYGPPFAFGPNEVADLCGPRARAVPDALRGALAEAAARGEALLVFIA